MTDKKSLMDVLDDFRDSFQESMKTWEQEQEAFWQSLTPEQQLQAFCAITRRIHRGEITERGTYRYVLYDVFGFGPESYAPAQVAGYLDIHNLLYDGLHSQQELDAYYHALTHIAAITTDEEIRKVVHESTKHVIKVT